ncbi:MAG TPA: GFA family protein [Gammaproteobacteria bacterium]|nr:GFA family protein [Gammaproteobacteria bacterium]
MSHTHEGGCLCGSVRYQVTGAPQVASICHCRYCQLRSGSAFSISVYFAQDQVQLGVGAVKTHELTTASGRAFDTRFCTECGTTVWWTIGTRPDSIGISGGTFDPPSFWYAIDREVFTRSSAAFISIKSPEQCVTHPAFDPVHHDPARLVGESKTKDSP